MSDSEGQGPTQDTYPPATKSLQTSLEGPATKSLPISSALEEAQPSSMQELFSRNPEYMQDQHIDAIVLNMRDLRARLEATATPPRHARVKDPNAPPSRSRSKKVVLEGFEDFDFNQA